MARTKRGVVSRAKHNKVLKSVKGQRGRRKNTIPVSYTHLTLPTICSV